MGQDSVDWWGNGEIKLRRGRFCRVGLDRLFCLMDGARFCLLSALVYRFLKRYFPGVSSLFFFFFWGVGQMWLCFFWDLWDALLILNFLGNFLQSFNDQLWQVFVMLSSATGFEGPD